MLTEVNDAGRPWHNVKARAAPARSGAAGNHESEDPFMTISDFCVRDVVCASRSDTISEAAALMREHHVGDVLVVDEVEGRRVPVGIVTDRDIVVEIVAAGVDPRTLKVGDLVLRPVVSVRDNRSFTDTVRLMTQHGVRRMPVVDADGALVGIVTVDDMVRQLALPLATLSELPRRGRHVEMQVRK